jgi:predicted unusual protein kinase regulating ubiquinone biosynthesis (AarF/ABC1/UbiB family)
VRVARRMLTIHRALVRYGLEDFVRATHLYRPLRFVFYLSPWTWFTRRRGTRAERLRLALEELGPIFVKFGQLLSTRRDLLPVDIADELARLQDRVPPFRGDIARARIEEALGRAVTELFGSFDEEPLAAASIAQVHAATLADGREVIVMERIHGVQISDVARLRAAGTDIKKLAENGVTIFFTQVFRHNFFHADMHPGNIFVDVSDPANPKYAAVDFGIVGTLDPRDQLYLAGNFLAFFERDYRKVAVLHVESGWVPAGTRVDELESAVRTICEPIFNKALKDISFGLVLLRLFEIARRFQMQIQPQLILLQKTLLNIEGVGRELYPELDLWKTALPILREWMRERNGPRAIAEHVRGHWPDAVEALKLLPVIARRAIRLAYDDRLVVQTESVSLEVLQNELRESRRRTDLIIAAAASFLGGVIWLALGTQPVWLGWLLAGGGALLLINRLR